MSTKLRDMDKAILQEAVNVESKRPSSKLSRGLKPISAKRFRNKWGLITAVLNKYYPQCNLKAIELPTVTPRSVELPPVKDVLQIIRGTDIELVVFLAIWLSFSI